MFLGILAIFIVLVCMIILLYSYFLRIVNKLFKVTNKYVKYIVLGAVIVLFNLSFIMLFRSEVFGIILVLLIYTLMMYFFIYIIDFFLKKNKLWNKIYLFIPITFSICFTVYGLFNMTNVVKTEYDIHNSKLTNNYKVALISDLHYGISLNDNELTKYANEISKEKPDFVVLAGDIVDERTTKEQMNSAFNILGSIDTKSGVYFAYGNHDKSTYTSKKNYTLSELEESITKNNITILEESKKYINTDVVLIGRGYDYRKNITDILERRDNPLYSIVIDHVPLEYDNYRENGINLDLSGHTHAGQIFPLGVLQKMINKNSAFINKFHKLSDAVYGKYEKDDFIGIVSSGIAGWGIPIRTESRSEYVIINLSK